MNHSKSIFRVNFTSLIFLENHKIITGFLWISFFIHRDKIKHTLNMAENKAVLIPVWFSIGWNCGFYTYDFSNRWLRLDSLFQSEINIWEWNLGKTLSCIRHCQIYFDCNDWVVLFREWIEVRNSMWFIFHMNDEALWSNVQNHQTAECWNKLREMNF